MSFPAPIVSAMLPFILWPIELFLPYPYIIEEIAKAGIILLIVKSKENTLTQAILAGTLFSFTETILYMFNAPLGSPGNTLVVRFFLTTPMHITTMVIVLALVSKSRFLLPVGVVLGTIVHYLFNHYIPLVSI